MLFFLPESDRNRVNISTVSNNQDKNFCNIRLPNLDSITVNGNPTIDIEISIKKYVDDELDEITSVRFKQSLQKFSK